MHDESDSVSPIDNGNTYSRNEATRRCGVKENSLSLFLLSDTDFTVACRTTVRRSGARRRISYTLVLLSRSLLREIAVYTRRGIRADQSAYTNRSHVIRDEQ